MSQQPYERGDVIRVNLNPAVGSEQANIRPCIVVSEPKTARSSGARLLYVIVPLTRSASLKGATAPRIEQREGGLPADSTALCLHVRSIDPKRVLGYVGSLEAGEYEPVSRGLGVLLGLES